MQAEFNWSQFIPSALALLVACSFVGRWALRDLVGNRWVSYACACACLFVAFHQFPAWPWMLARPWSLILALTLPWIAYAAASRFDNATAAQRIKPADASDHHKVHLHRWWTVLGVSPNASDAEVTTAYHQRAREYHPDRLAGLGPDLVALAETRMKEINAALAEARARRA